MTTVSVRVMMMVVMMRVVMVWRRVRRISYHYSVTIGFVVNMTVMVMDIDMVVTVLLVSYAMAMVV